MALTFEANNKKLSLNRKNVSRLVCQVQKCVCFSMSTALLLPLVFITRIYSSFLHSTVSYVTHCLRMRSPFGPENLWTKFTRSRYCQSACSCRDVGQARLHWLKRPREWTCECPALHPSTHQSWARLKWGREACCPEFFITAHAGRITSPRENDVSYSAARLRVRDICQVVSWVMTSTCSLSPASNQNIWIWL